MPKIIVDYDLKDRLGAFVDFLKDRVCDPTYEDKRNIIADFIDGFLAVEMKRLQDSKETRQETIDIPEDLLMEPLRKAHKMVDREFRRLLGDKVDMTEADATNDIDEGIKQAKEKAKKLTETPDAEAKPDVAPAVDVTAKVTAKSGNGHAKLKIRKLTDPERDIIRAEFLTLNGEITDDACLPIKGKLDPVISIFQVTGFVTYLHGQVACGATQVRDLPAYEAFLQMHRELWATYNSDRSRAKRAEWAKKHPKP